MRKIYTIPVDFEGSRFDRWFKRKINKVPQSLLEKYLSSDFLAFVIASS